jgi:hypothetical protein
MWLGQVADLELHTWYSRVTPSGDGVDLPTTYAGSIENIEQSALGHPDFIVFDLDPYLYSGQEKRGEEPELHPEGFEATCQMALWLKQVLDSLGLASFVKTTGKTGLHIYVPIARTLDYRATHSLSATLANYWSSSTPKEATTEWAVDKRRGKVFVDYNQNVRGKTLASIYSPRVAVGGGVDADSWGRGGQGLSDRFHAADGPDRLAQGATCGQDPGGEAGCRATPRLARRSSSRATAGPSSPSCARRRTAHRRGIAPYPSSSRAKNHGAVRAELTELRQAREAAAAGANAACPGRTIIR